MNSLSSTIKSADWKSEKHVPVLTLPDGAKPGEAFDAEVAVGTLHAVAYRNLHGLWESMVET